MKFLDGINWGVALGIVVAVETQIGNGSMSIAKTFPADWIPAIKEQMANLGTIGALIAAALAYGKVPSASTVGKVGMAFLVGALALLSVEPARAGDIAQPALTTKAAPAPQAYGTSGSYFGVFTEGGGGSVSATVAGVNSASLVTNQIGIGGLVGYARSVPGSDAFMAIEGMAKVNNVNGSQPGFSWNGPASFTERFKVGVPLDKVTALIPNLGLPTAAPFPVLPAGTLLLNTKSYIFGAFHQDDNSYAVAGLPAFSAVKLSGGIGTGMIGQLSNGTALDIWAEASFANSEHCFGAIRVCAKDGTKYTAGLAVDF